MCTRPAPLPGVEPAGGRLAGVGGRRRPRRGPCHDWPETDVHGLVSYAPETRKAPAHTPGWRGRGLGQCVQKASRHRDRGWEMKTPGQISTMRAACGAGGAAGQGLQTRARSRMLWPTDWEGHGVGGGCPQVPSDRCGVGSTRVRELRDDLTRSLAFRPYAVLVHPHNEKGREDPRAEPSRSAQARALSSLAWP